MVILVGVCVVILVAVCMVILMGVVWLYWWVFYGYIGGCLYGYIGGYLYGYCVTSVAGRHIGIALAIVVIIGGVGRGGVRLSGSNSSKTTNHIWLKFEMSFSMPIRGFTFLGVTVSCT